MKVIYKGMLSGGVCGKVYLNFKESGCSVDFPHDGEPYHIIKIGAFFEDWSEVYDGILHEMMELHMCNMELCFQRWYRGGSDAGDVIFHFTHADYSECISRTAQALLQFVDIAKKEFDIHRENVVEIALIKTKPLHKDILNDSDDFEDGDIL